MAKRFCGGVTVTLDWKDFGEGYYRTHVSCAEGARNLKIAENRNLAALGTHVTAPEAFDKAAEEALKLAMDDSFELSDEEKLAARYIADAAADGLINGKYQLLRKRENDRFQSGAFTQSRFDSSYGGE